MADSSDGLYSRYNTDDVLVRSVIAGLLDILNNKISYTQAWADDTVETVRVPWMYNFGVNGERFKQDNYDFFGYSCFGKRIEGNFDMFPRGAISYASASIESGSITNRFVLGKYMRNENGRLRSYVSYMYSIPLTMSFSCEVWYDNMVSGLKIEQEIREEFYKNRSFYVTYRGMQVNCCVGFPESYGNEKSIEFTFGSDDKRRITFDLSVETYQPVFDRTTELPADTSMRGIGYDVYLVDSSYSASLSLTSPRPYSEEPVVYPSGYPLGITWDSSSNNSDMTSLALGYEDASGAYHFIDRSVRNTGLYVWNVPEGMSDYVQPEIVVTDNGRAEVVRPPEIAIVPDAETMSIDAGSFVVKSRGFFFMKDGDASINFSVDYTDSSGEVHMGSNYYFNISNSRLDDENPVTVSGDPLKYVNGYHPARIDIVLSYVNDSDVSSRVGIRIA